MDQKEAAKWRESRVRPVLLSEDLDSVYSPRGGLGLIWPQYLCF